jgi:N-methylhydantoinase B
MPKDLPSFDAVEMAIHWSRLIAIVDQAAAALVRTSFSTVIRESNDFACVLFDAHGRSLAQSTISVPGFIGTMPQTLREMLKRIPREKLEPGDVLITNDPWMGTGHLHDLTMATPVFKGSDIVAFTCVTAHLPDVGGRQWSAAATEVYEEGLWIPVVKYYRHGRLNEDMHRILEANVRNPEQVIGDVRAQLAATSVMAGKLLDFMEDARLQDLTSLAGAIHGVSEQAMVKALREVPEGIYVGETHADGWGAPLTIRARVVIRDSRIAVDYDGTSPQSSRGINAVFNHTYAFTIYPFKSVLVPEIPNNEGFMRLFDIQAPPGSIVNAQPPAAVGARHLVGHLLQGAIFQALGKAVPDRVQADSGTPLWSVVFKGPSTERTKPFTTVLFFNGGTGATGWADGSSCTSFPTNISIAPIEIVETLSPLRFRYKRLAADSGGAGKWRGGCGQDIAIESVAQTPMSVSLLTERTKFPAVGLNGGHPGRCGFVRVNGRPAREPKGTVVLNPGDVLELGLPGGGGFGDVKARDPELVEHDVQEGYVTLKHAKRQTKRERRRPRFSKTRASTPVLAIQHLTSP